jgi:hypothetical protein
MTHLNNIKIQFNKQKINKIEIIKKHKNLKTLKKKKKIKIK